MTDQSEDQKRQREKPKQQRESRLITEGSPCEVNYFDDTLLTVEQAIKIGRVRCGRFDQCKKEGKVFCALRVGSDMAAYVVKGSSLRRELNDFYQEGLKGGWFNNAYINTVDRKHFEMITGKGKILRAVEGFARIVLMMDPFESDLPKCEKCGGMKLTKIVYDSIHDGPFPLSGSGRTRKRAAEYCPDCDPEPRGGIIDEEPDKRFFTDTEQARGLGRRRRDG